MCRRVLRVIVFSMAAVGLVTALQFPAHAQDPVPIDGPEELLPDEVSNRVYVWKNDNSPGRFVPSGYMPDGLSVSLTPAAEDEPHSPPHCLRCEGDLSGNNPWVGVYFLHRGEWVPDDACDLDRELQPTDQESRSGAAQSIQRTMCRFWARSKSEQATKAQFKVGGVVKGQIKDSLKFPVATKWITLTKEWTMYEIDLTGKDLSSVVGGFLWVCDRQHNGSREFEFDLDDIYFVKTRAAAGSR